MPLYDYGCKKEDCKHVFETFHKLADPGPSACPVCGHTEIGKLISAVHGSVELSSDDLKVKIKEDVIKLKQEASKSPNILANLVGEEKFHKQQLADDKFKKEQ